ncbi:hypothetical protein C4K40_0268 [Pseudomonas sp. CMR5c]|nr:hypothetical protein C4K40_0268 [Pseudomonas sp. CMR5c]
MRSAACGSGYTKRLRMPGSAFRGRPGFLASDAAAALNDCARHTSYPSLS